MMPRVRTIALPMLAWALTATAARAVRWPNDFAEAHWLLDYRFGFIRRGLGGQALALAMAAGLATPTAATIAAIAAVGFGTLLATVLVVASRLAGRGPHPAEGWLLGLVFVTSPFVVMSAHLMGYLDHLIAVAAIAAAWLALRDRWGGAAAVAVAGVLVHENFAALGLPLLVLAIWRRAGVRPGALADWRLWIPLAAPGVTLAALAGVEYALLDRARLRQQLTDRLLTFEFIQGDFAYFVPEWLTTSLADALRPGWLWVRLTDPWLVGMAAPTVVACLAFTWLASPRTEARVRVLALAAACALPLGLHLVAWDTARIWAYPLLIAYAGTWLLAESGATAPGADESPAGTRPGVAARWFRAAALVAVLVNVFGRFPLMDNETERFAAPVRAALYAPVLIGAAWLALRDPGRSPSEQV